MPRLMAGIVKAPGEKLVRVRFHLDAGRVSGLKISGDFFIHPEDAVERIENSLNNLPFDENSAVEKLKNLIRGGTIELVGVSPESIARAIATSVPVE
jgi:lipoate---protein ligase